MHPTQGDRVAWLPMLWATNVSRLALPNGGHFLDASITGIGITLPCVFPFPAFVGDDIKDAACGSTDFR
jgi:hypothetical protein